MKKITITPIDVSGKYILRNAVAQGESGGHRFEIDMAMNGDLIFTVEDSVYAVPLRAITDKIVPAIIAQLKEKA